MADTSRYARGLSHRRDSYETPRTPPNDRHGTTGGDTLLHRQAHATVGMKEDRDAHQTSNSTTGTIATSQSGHSARQRHRRAHKTVERLPFLRAPSRDNDGPWLKPSKAQSAWFALFYDLALVAVLTVFSGTHELTEPSAIPIFLSYFAILSWIWTSQCFYDIRYEADDVFHHLIKSCQIVAFIFIGAASGNWNLQAMRSPSTVPGIGIEDAARNLSTEESFTTIAVAFAISRGLLLLQYIVSMLLGVRAGRTITPLIISGTSVLLGLVSLIIAAALPFTTDRLVEAKIALVYLPLGLEIAGGWIQLRKSWHHQVSTENIGERYGSLTLIILGEGFISLTRAFSSAISGLSEKTTTTYAQVFLAITIIVFTFLFLFGRFNKEDHIHHSRVIIWETIHFPLHFSLLLLLAAMVNFIVALSFSLGIRSVTTQFESILDSFQGGTLSQTDADALENYIAKLQLQPPFDQELQEIKMLNASNRPTYDVAIMLDQYAGQIVLQTIRSYGIDIPDQVFDLFGQLESLNTTIDYGAANVTESKQTVRNEATNIVLEMITIPIDHALSGIVWLFPSAGAVLIFAAIRSMVWYRFVGIAHWIIHAPMWFSGVALCLLGFLDLGNPTVQVTHDGSQRGHSPIITLIYHSLPLAIIMIVYSCTYYTSLFAMACVQRIKGGVYGNADQSIWIAE